VPSVGQLLTCAMKVFIFSIFDHSLYCCIFIDLLFFILLLFVVCFLCSVFCFLFFLIFFFDFFGLFPNLHFFSLEIQFNLNFLIKKP
jgi:hypothetical protein